MTVLNSSSLISSGGIAFGTSGARGLVVDFKPEICAAFTHAFVAVMRRDFNVKSMAIAIDNRPSSYGIAQACAAALIQVGIGVIYYGVIPTPALAYQAIAMASSFTDPMERSLKRTRRRSSLLMSILHLILNCHD